MRDDAEETRPGAFEVGYFPLALLGKTDAVSEIEAINGAGSFVGIVSEIECRPLMQNALLGCILFYEGMQHAYGLLNEDAATRFGDCCPDLLPGQPIRMPSKRILDGLTIALESDGAFKGFDELGGWMRSLFDEMGGLTRPEEETWETIWSIFEFKHLLLEFANKRLVVAMADIDTPGNETLILRYVETKNVTWPPARQRVMRGLRALVSAVVGVVVCAGIVSAVHRLDAGLACGGIAGLLYAFFISHDFVTGCYRFTGLKSYRSLDALGTAEEESLQIKAPAGSVFSPIGGPCTDGQWAYVADWGKGASPPLGDDVADPYVLYSLTPAEINMRMHEGWNNDDPVSILEGSEGHRFRKLPYRPEDAHDYYLAVMVRPKTGRRSIGYAITPLITLFSLVILWNGSQNAVAALASLMPMVALAFTVSEEESFSKQIVLGLPRSGWKLSVAIAAIAIVVRFALPASMQFAWNAIVPAMFALLVASSVLGLAWLCFHLWKDSWADSVSSFDYRRAIIRRME